MTVLFGAHAHLYKFLFFELTGFSFKEKISSILPGFRAKLKPNSMKRRNYV